MTDQPPTTCPACGSQVKDAYARIEELEAALDRACRMLTTTRIGQIGTSQVYTPQVDVEHVAQLRAALKGDEAK